MQLVCAYGVAMDESCSQLKSEGTKLTQLIAVNTLEFARPLNSLVVCMGTHFAGNEFTISCLCDNSLILFGTLIAVHWSCFDLVDIMVHGL